MVSYCDIHRDMPTLAISTIQKAISLDPKNWNFRYDLGIMRASAGLDPMPALRKALALNPREQLIKDALQTFSGDSPTQWQSDGKTISDQFTTL